MSCWSILRPRSRTWGPWTRDMWIWRHAHRWRYLLWMRRTLGLAQVARSVDPNCRVRASEVIPLAQETWIRIPCFQSTDLWCVSFHYTWTWKVVVKNGHVICEVGFNGMGWECEEISELTRSCALCFCYGRSDDSPSRWQAAWWSRIGYSKHSIGVSHRNHVFHGSLGDAYK